MAARRKSKARRKTSRKGVKRMRTPSGTRCYRTLASGQRRFVRCPGSKAPARRKVKARRRVSKKRCSCH